MSNEDNPLAVLGLTKNLVQQVPERSLLDMVERHYRALMHTFHPDKGGSKDHATEINDAMERFQKNPTVWRKAYLSKLAKPKKSTAVSVDQSSKAICLLIEAVLRASLAGQYIDLVGLGTRTVRINKPHDDVVEDKTGVPGRYRKVRRFIPPVGDESGFRSIKIDWSRGKLTIATNKGEPKDHRRMLIGVITPETCLPAMGGKSSARVHVVITSLYKEVVQATTKRLPPADRLTTAWDGGYSPLVFTPSLGLMTWGNLLEYGSLFSVGLDSENTLRFYHEGTICSVD